MDEFSLDKEDRPGNVATMSNAEDPFLERWSPELRRAVIAVAPDFFRWNPQRQLRYRVDPPEDDRKAIVKALTAAIAATGGESSFAAAVEEDHLPRPIQECLNALILPLLGIGRDAFYLNEQFAEGINILDFATLRDYDARDHEFQERSNAEEDPNHQRRPYLGRLYHRWARVLIEGRISYLSLTMAAGYLHDRISDATSDEIQRLIPHRHVPGPDDGKVEKGLVRWDVRIDAGGQEALLDELHHRVWKYEQARWRELEATWAEDRRCGCYLLPDPEPGSEDGSLDLHIVFTDPLALGRVRFATFLDDCRAIERCADELHQAGTAESERAVRFVAEQYQDLRANFDPKVTRLRKRLKVVMHRGALDDLAGFEEP